MLANGERACKCNIQHTVPSHPTGDDDSDVTDLLLSRHATHCTAAHLEGGAFSSSSNFLSSKFGKQGSSTHFRSLSCPEGLAPIHSAEMEKSADRSMEEGSRAYESPSSPLLPWQMARKNRKVWWMSLAGIFTLFVLISYAGPRKVSGSDALLDTVLNETLGVS